MIPEPSSTEDNAELLVNFNEQEVFESTSHESDNELLDESYIYPQSTSFGETLMNTLKSYIGVGITNSPYAIYKSGLIAGPILLALICLPTVYCMFQLLDVSKEVTRRTKRKNLGFGGTAKHVFIPFFGDKAVFICYAINFCIILSQLGVCCIYLVFTGEIMNEILEVYALQKSVCIGIIFCLIFFPSFISQLEILAIFSFMANIFAVTGLTATVVYLFTQIPNQIPHRLYPKITDLPIFICSVMYTFEGIGTILPFKNGMREPEKFPLIIQISIVFFMLLYTTVGVLGYYVYGDNLHGSVFYDLPSSTFFNIVKLVYSFGVLLTFFIQFYVAANIIIPRVCTRIVTPALRTFTGISIRTFLLVFTLIASVTIPQLENVISLVGATGCISLSFIFPPLLHIATFCINEVTFKPQRFGMLLINSFLIVIGLACMCLGVTVTVKKIIHDMKM